MHALAVGKGAARRGRTRLAGGLLLAASTAALAGSASAQVARFDDSLMRTGLFARDRNTSVAERSKPGYEPLPLPIAPLIVVPTLTTSMGYDDNIYARDGGGPGGPIVRITPAFSANGLWFSTQVKAFAGVTANEYPTRGSEDTVDYYADVVEATQLDRDTLIQAGGSFGRMTEDRASLGSPTNNARPIRYNQADAFIGAIHTGSRIRLESYFSVRDLDYSNNTTFGGAPLIQTYRDRTAIKAYGRAEYAVTPTISLFAEATGNDRIYRNQLLLNRDSHGFDASVGVNFDVAGLARGDIAVGFMDQMFDDPTLRDVSGPSVSGRLSYFATPLITLTVTGNRSIEDATIVSAAGYIDTNASLRADYELLRNVVVNASVAYEQDRYVGMDRTDSQQLAGIGADYWMNRSFRWNVRYDMINQSSSGALRVQSFVVNRLSLSLTYLY